MIGMYVTLAAIGQLPDWLAILVVFRDLLIVGGVIAAVDDEPPDADTSAGALKGEHRAADRAGRRWCWGSMRLGWQVAPLRMAMVTLVTASTLLSGGAYVVRTARGS